MVSFRQDLVSQTVGWRWFVDVPALFEGRCQMLKSSAGNPATGVRQAKVDWRYRHKTSRGGLVNGLLRPMCKEGFSVSLAEH